MARQAANTQLTALLRQTGWSGQGLANAVNAAGAENGLALRYDRTSVAHWLAGSRPSPTVAALVAEVLSRRLGRMVTLTETGFATPTGRPDSTDDVVTHLVQLGNVAERGTSRRQVYTVAQPALPNMAELATNPPPAARSGERVGTAHVKAANLMLSLFSRTDLAFGGGTALPALSAYLATDVASWLRATTAPSTRARLYTIAARLTYLAGWMCFDDNQQGPGQRYYHTAARLAAIGGDCTCYAAAVRGLSVQAHYLGHHAVALSLAETAMRHARRVPPLEAAFLTGQLAVTEAARGHHAQAHAHMARAARMLDQASADNAAVGSYHIASLLHQQAETLASSGDTKAAIKALTGSLRHRPLAERRARAVTSARLADLYLDTGRLDHACEAWTTLLDDRSQLTSGRVEQAVRTMRARLRPHTRYPPAMSLVKRASSN